MAFELLRNQDGRNRVFITRLVFYLLYCKSNALMFRESEPIMNNSLQNPEMDSTAIPLELINKNINQDTHFEGSSPITPSEYIQATQMDDSMINFSLDDPTVKSGLFEGDILLNERMHFLLTMYTNFPVTYQKSPLLRNSLSDKSKLWPNGIVPYVISSSFSSSDRQVIGSAFALVRSHSCIEFVARTDQINYVRIVKGSGCSSSVGMNGDGVQELSLGNGCVFLGIVTHELLHSLGFFHEQSRPDRESYIIVHYQNIQTSMRYNFNVYEWGVTSNQSCSYDEGSIMHYSPYAFSKNGKKTLTSLRGNKQMGQRGSMSKIDIAKLVRLYNCPNSFQYTCDSTGTISKPKPKPKPTRPPPPPPPPSTPSPTRPTRPLPVEQTCDDKHIHCVYWAGDGQCLANKAWMPYNCPKSCWKCPCKDLRKDCGALALKGHCSKRLIYMLINCRFTCDLCECKDNKKECTSWKNQGECTKNPSYMILVCPISCEVCI